MPTKLILAIIALAAIAAGAYLFFCPAKTSAPAGTPVAAADYLSPELGIAFDYPTESYDVQLHQDTGAEPAWKTLTLLPKGFVPPEGGEGPPALSIQMFDYAQDVGLGEWLVQDYPRSNYALITDGTLATTTVAGETALRYQHDGLYQTDAVALEHGGNIYLFSAGWLAPEDRTRADLENILATVRFID